MTTGPTSEDDPRVSHSCDLVERHRITLPVGATGDNVAVARLHAEAYARARGFELSAGSMSVLNRKGDGYEALIGVTFEVLARRDDLDRGRRVVPGPWRGPDALSGRSLMGEVPTWEGGSAGPHTEACDGEPHPGSPCPVDYP